MSIVKRRKGNRDYYYMVYDSKGLTRRQHEAYLGKEIPENVTDLKKEFVLSVKRTEWVPKLETIRDSFRKEKSKMPQSALEKNLRNFSIRFTYNTQRIEGSALTMRDTTLLLEDDVTPPNRPNRDVKEAEAHQGLFLDVMGRDGDLSLDVVKEWHQRLFEGTQADIAGQMDIPQTYLEGIP